MTYSDPFEHRLRLTAEGYEERTQFFSHDELRSAAEIEIALTPLETDDAGVHDSANPAPDVLRGRVLHEGKPVADGWLRVEIPLEECDIWNVRLVRGCPVPVGTGTIERVAIATDGSFELKSVHPGFAYLVADVPGLPLQVRATQILPHEAWPDGRPEFQFEAVPPGKIQGSVQDVPPMMRGRLWAVAFDEAVVRRAVRIRADDTFVFEGLPPGDYGIRVGHDSWSRLQGNYPEIFPKDAEEPITAQPWTGIEPIHLAPGATVDSIEVRFGAP